MTHETIQYTDLDLLYENTPQKSYKWHHICSPFNIWCNERLRAGLEKNLPASEKMPVDVIVWGRGEPSKLSVTKVGGTPVWWSLSEPPKDMFYFGQVGLMDSPQAMGKVTGDVISIWGSKDFPYGKMQAFILDSRSLTHVPEVGLVDEVSDKLPFYGVLHRSFDIPRSLSEQLGELEVEGKYGPRPFRFDPWESSKIGGISSRLDKKKKGDFLLQIMSIQAHPEQLYPWANVKDPLEVSGTSKKSYALASNQVSIGDMGFIIISVKNGVVEASLIVE